MTLNKLGYEYLQSPSGFLEAANAGAGGSTGDNILQKLDNILSNYQSGPRGYVDMLTEVQNIKNETSPAEGRQQLFMNLKERAETIGLIDADNPTMSPGQWSTFIKLSMPNISDTEANLMVSEALGNVDVLKEAAVDDIIGAVKNAQPEFRSP